jgi:hypothetical protein
MSQQQQYSPPGSSHYVAEHTGRPSLNPARSFSAQTDDSSSMSNNGSMSGPKAVRNGNRQSVHNGTASRDGSHSNQAGQMPAYSTSVVPQGSQGQPYKSQNQQQSQQQQQQAPPSQQQQQQVQQQADVGRGTPQPSGSLADEMTEEDIAQLLKDHKELRESFDIVVYGWCAPLISQQGRNTPRSRSTTLKRRIKSNNSKIVWPTSVWHNREPLWTIVNTRHGSTDWTGWSRSLLLASVRAGGACHIG